MRYSSEKRKEPNEEARKTRVYAYIRERVRDTSGMGKKRVRNALHSHIVQGDYIGLCPTECKQDHVTSVCETPSCRFSELESISRGIANGTAVFFLSHILFKSDKIKKSYYMRDQEYFFSFK